jgi:glycosyltransferase involved in cell wall biosynthesis
VSKKINILLNTDPLNNANAYRGVGMYTKFLFEYLQKIDSLKIVKSTSVQAQSFNPDVVHFPFFDLFFTTLPVINARKTVVTIHDVIPLIFPKHYPTGVKGSLALKQQQMALKTVEAVITDSKASKKDIAQYLGYSQEKIHVIPLAGNPNIKQTSQKEIQRVRKKYQLPKEYVLYVGDINYNKNIPQLIKAIKYLPKKISLVLVGKNFKEQNIPEWQWIQTQIELSNVSDRVCMINNIQAKDDSELSAIYSGAFCYVQPSLYEGFGLPILEAMQAQTPVVSCQNSSLLEVGAGNVVYTDCNAESIADGVKQVMAWTDEKRAEVIEQALGWANTFSWDKTAQETYVLYQSLL